MEVCRWELVSDFKLSLCSHPSIPELPMDVIVFSSNSGVRMEQTKLRHAEYMPSVRHVVNAKVLPIMIMEGTIKGFTRESADILISAAADLAAPLRLPKAESQSSGL